MHQLASSGLGTGLLTEHIPARAEIILRMVVALVLAWTIGFERELRGSQAGDRTFGMVGVGSAVIGYLAIIGHAPNALAGVVTGIGFLGAGLIIHGGDGSMVKGVTTAATIYVAAAVGAAVGQGQFLVAIVCTAMTLLVLEIRHVRWMRWADGRYWARRLGTAGDDPDNDAVT